MSQMRAINAVIQGPEDAAERELQEEYERDLNAAGGVERRDDESDEEEGEDVGDGLFRSVDDLGRVLSRDDPDRMKLTQEEHERAVLIKNMVEMMPDLDDLSDFMYAQLAIVCKDDVDDAIRRCIGLQDFRQEFKILDNYEQGCRYLKKPFEFFPRHLLSFDFCAKNGKYVFVNDFSQFEPKAFTSPESVEEWMISMYYFHFLFMPDLEAVRTGYVALVECQNFTMRRDVLRHVSEMFSSFLCHYPLNTECRHFNTGTMVNMVSSILRKILPEDLRRRYQVGFQFERGHLGDCFLVPNVAAANQRMLARMQDTLRRRCDNEKSFKLQALPR